MHGVQTLYARFKLGGNAGFNESGLDSGLNFLKEFFVPRRLVADFFLQCKESFRLEIAERQVLQLAAHDTHTEAERDRRIDVQSFARNALLLFGLEVFERAHVVKPVGQLNQNDADIVHHGEQHLADVFGLALFGSHHFEAADFGYAFDEMSDVGAKALFDPGDGILRIFDGVVENRGGEGGGVETHVREDVGDFEQVSEIRVTRTAELVVVTLGGDFVGAADHPGIFGGAVLAELFKKLLEARVELANGAVAVEAQRDFVRRRHGLVYA